MPTTSSTILIVNPPRGHAGYVGAKHAVRWIRQGKAAFDPDGRLRLTEKLRASIAGTIHGGLYDAISRNMTSAEKRHIPLAQPPVRPTRR